MAQKPGPFKTKVKELILLSHCFLACQFSNGYDETGVRMDNFQWIISNGCMQLSSARLLFPRRGLANVQPWSDQTDRTCAPPSLWRPVCIYPSGMPVNAKLLVVARSCQAARQGTRHLALPWLGKTRLLGSARPTGQNYFPSCCFLLIINSTGPIGNLSFRVTPSAFR